MSGKEVNIQQTNAQNLQLYLLWCYGGEWEDAKIVVGTEKAMELSKMLGHTARLEKFEVDKNGVYCPTYNYYENGTFVCE
jgi:hypothetical protein